MYGEVDEALKEALALVRIWVEIGGGGKGVGGRGGYAQCHVQCDGWVFGLYMSRMLVSD